MPTKRNKPPESAEPQQVQATPVEKPKPVNWQEMSTKEFIDREHWSPDDFE